MPGKKLTDKQVTRYLKYRREGKTQAFSADQAGISEASAVRIDNNMRVKKPRNWKTRKNPFEAIWESFIVPLLKKGELQATFILEQLQKAYPELYPNSLLRTLQRKIKEWKALYGKDKVVIFRQDHEPGVLGISDFSHPDDKITIKGKPLIHIFYHFRLQYSGFSYIQVFKGSGEAYTIFADGLDGALTRIGGTPKKHRTDSLSAAFKNLSKEAQDDLTERYEALAHHYGMEPLRINPGKSHENGGVESPHGHIKNRIRQSLIIRGSSDFNSFEEYQGFITEVVNDHNQRHTKGRFETEQPTLQSLPLTKGVDYTEVPAVVSSTSTIQVKGVMYSVPSRLIGERLSVRVYNDRLECCLGLNHVITLERVYPTREKKRARKIDFRHLINSLVKKPQAFRNSILRDDLLPNDTYKSIWKHVDKTMDNKTACKFIVGLLYLAAKENCLDELANMVIEMIQTKKKLCLKELQDRFTPKRKATPAIEVKQHPLTSYNNFIPKKEGEEE